VSWIKRRGGCIRLLGISMVRKALVTGANGFIGRYVARHLHQQGWFVQGVGHGDWSIEEARLWGVSSWLKHDISLISLREHADKLDLVIHCAGSGSVAASMNAPYVDFQKTVGSTMEVLEYVRTESPDALVVYPSSAAVYGACEQMPLKQDRQLRPLSPYGQHKVIAENLIKEYSSIYGLNAIIVRLFSVYGRELRKQLLWEACSRLRKGDNIFFGTGNETRDWLHVNDAAGLLVSAAAHASKECPVINGGSGIATTNRELLTLITQFISEAQRPEFNNQVRDGDPQHYHADMSAVADWAWTPAITLAEGLADYMAWAQKEQL